MKVSGQRRAPAALPRRKIKRNSLNERLDGPQSRSGRFGEEKTFPRRDTNPVSTIP